MFPAAFAIVVWTMQAADAGEQRYCGSKCLFVALRGLDLGPESAEELEERLGPPSPQGYNFAELADAARGYGAQTLGVLTSFENLQRRPRPFVCIAHVDNSHFVLITDVAKGVATVVDPPRKYEIPVDTLRNRWKGTALLLSRSPLIPEEDLAAASRWPWLVGSLAIVSLIVAGWVGWRRR
jgi:ABC-type bacteriocin/lantibiotic exporter with double-glycine peptidase domain